MCSSDLSIPTSTSTSAAFRAPLPLQNPPAPPVSAPHISFINAVAFLKACKLPGVQSFHLYLNSPTSAKSSVISDTPDLSNIPEEYHDYADIFSKGKANTLPLHCPYDLKIDLEDRTEPPIGPILPLSQTELQALREFIDELLSSGFI